MRTQQFDNSITLVRALCVIAIVVFHIDKSWLPLGYLGVDLFFVLSGYLITSIIIKQSSKGEFTFSGFYKRRFMRLMPAFYGSLFFTLLAALVADFHLVELSEFLASSISSLLFAANVYFWQNTGYFVATTNIVENIHHWSLSVEEQFYFFWPICLLILLRFFKVHHWVFILMVATLTLVSVYLWTQYPRPAFYLLPTRAWQFLVGALVAIHSKALFERFQKVYKSLPLAGILLVVGFGSLTPDFEYKVPIITVAISLFLSAYLVAGKSGFLLRILENRFTIWIGLSSYSIYLVHQPVFAVSRKLLVHPDVQEWSFVLVMVVLVLVFGAILYLVERHFRYNQISGLSMIVAHVCILGAFASIYLSLPKPTITTDFADPAKFDYGCETRNKLGCYVKGGDFEGNTSVLLLGNSHARMLLPAFREAGRNVSVLHPDKLSSSILGGSDDIAIQLDTPNEAKSIWMDEICRIAGDFDAVAIAYRYIGYVYKSQNVHLFSGSFSEDRLQQLEHRINELAKCSSMLVVVGQVPELDFWPRNVFRKSNDVVNAGSMSQAQHERISKPITGLLERVASANENVRVVNPSDALCDGVRCYAFQRSANGSIATLYYDDDHLNSLGSQPIVSEILRLSEEQ